MKNQKYVVLFVLAISLRAYSDICGQNPELTLVAQEYVEVPAPRAYSYIFQMCIDKPDLKELKVGVEFTVFFYYAFEADNVSQPVAGRLNWTYSDEQLERLESSIDFLDGPSNDTHCTTNEPYSRYTCKANGTANPDEIFHTFKVISLPFQIKYNLTTGSPCQVKKRGFCDLEQRNTGGLLASIDSSNSNSEDDSKVLQIALSTTGGVLVMLVICILVIVGIYAVYKRVQVKTFLMDALDL